MTTTNCQIQTTRSLSERIARHHEQRRPHQSLHDFLKPARFQVGFTSLDQFGRSCARAERVSPDERLNAARQVRDKIYKNAPVLVPACCSYQTGEENSNDLESETLLHTMPSFCCARQVLLEKAPDFRDNTVFFRTFQISGAN